MNQAPAVMEVTEAGDRGASFNVFGPVVMPRNQMIVRWAGSVSDVPVFAGGVVAWAIASATDSPTSTVGVLASPRVKRVRRLLAFEGTGAARRLYGLAEVATSAQTATAPDGSIVPSRQLSVLDWRLCNVGVAGPAPPDPALARCP
jgi:hypothetical protein